MAGPIAGKRVVDVSERSPSAMIAGMILTDLGAEVIRVEPEGGDPLRALPGSRVWLRGQKSVVLTPERVKDGSWAAMRASADVVLDTTQPWTDKPAGLLKRWSPGASQILALITASPQSVEEALVANRQDAEPVYGELAEARLGIMNNQKGVREGPIFLAWPHAAYGAAWLTIIGVLGALYERDKTGKGQVLTTSLMEGIIAINPNGYIGGDTIEALPRSPGAQPPSRSGGGTFRCGDGRYVYLHTMARGSFDRLMTAIGRGDLADPSITSVSLPMEANAYATMRGDLEQAMLSKPAQHWFDVLSKEDVPCMIANAPGDILMLEQPIINGLVDIRPDGRRQFGKLGKFARTKMEVGAASPTPGQHTTEVLRTARPLAARRRKAIASRSRVGPLDGVLVLDFGFFLAGPYANRNFADLGARVIKIEEVGGDPFRGFSSAIFQVSHRGKESFAVDLKTEEGRNAIYELVRRADVVHHNMRAGALPRLGIDYDTLSAINPKLIYCHSSGYGNEGPWSKLPAFEPLHSAVSGVFYRMAGPGNPPQNYQGNMDYGCGLSSASMVLAALVERESSGKGQYIEVPQTGAGIFAMSDVHFQGDQKFDGYAIDSQQYGIAPTNAVYRTTDGWVLVACYSDKEWIGVQRALSIAGGVWPDYPQARREPLAESKAGEAIGEAIAALTTMETIRRLEGEGVPCVVPTPYNLNDLPLQHRLRQQGVVVMSHAADTGAYWGPGHLVRFSRRTRVHTRPAPMLGQHTVQTLREIGTPQAQIEGMLERRSVKAAQA